MNRAIGALDPLGDYKIDPPPQRDHSDECMAAFDVFGDCVCFYDDLNNDIKAEMKTDTENEGLW